MSSGTSGEQETGTMDADSDTPSPVPSRRRQARAEETRRALLDAALTEFADKGFDAASTRAIASAAGTHQPQINYHFDSKEALWRATVHDLFRRLDEVLEPHDLRTDESASNSERLASFIRGFVLAASKLPELNRIMVREATSDSPRLRWIVDHYTRPRFDEVVRVWREMQADPGVNRMDDSFFYYSLIGATSLAYANAPEARLLGRDPDSDDFVSAHADAVVRMFLPSLSDH